MISITVSSRTAHAPLVNPVLWRLIWREAGTLLGVVAALVLAVFA